MRADNNWEDSVGKRLFEVEGELSPQAWENISRRIAPKPKRRPLWYWLPALLLFLALPLAFYQGNLFKNKSSEVAKNETKPAEEKETTSRSNNNLESQEPITGSETQNEKPAQRKTETATPEKATPNQIAANQGIKNNAPVTPNQTNVKILPPVKENEKAETPEKAKKNLTSKTGKSIVTSVIIAKQTKKPVISKMNGSESTKNAIETTTKTTASEQPNATKIASTNNPNNGVILAENGEQNATIKSENNQSITPVSENSEPVNSDSETALNEKVVAAGNSETTIPTAQDSVKKELAAALTEVAKDSVAKEAKPEELKEKKQFAWSIYGTPQYTFQRVFANTTDDIMILSMTNKNDFESERFGYEFGFRGYYPIKEKVQLEFGFQFARINHHIKFRTANTGMADSVIVNQQPGQLTLEIRNREQNEILLFKYFFGGLYSGVNYHLGHGWKLSGGLGANWLLWKNPDEEQFPIPTRSLNPYLSAGLRYQVALSQEVTLQAGPTLQYFVKPVQKKSAHYGAKPTTFGFTVGLLFSGNK